MSGDEDLRTIERDIALDPGALDLRRRHAQALLRAGDADRGLAALDLAWRLGADDLWDDLRARLEARAVRLPGLELRYVPGGPFAMGADDLDEDARPLHLVHLSAFYIAAKPLVHGALEGWRYNYVLQGTNEASMKYWRPLATIFGQHANALDAIAWLDSRPKPPGLVGRFTLVSEAQWERVFRASHFRRDGVNVYGVSADGSRPEWTADRYEPDAYDGGPRRDPLRVGDGRLFTVRGIPGLPAPIFALYREAADANGQFPVPGAIFEKTIANLAGIVARPVFLPARAPS